MGRFLQDMPGTRAAASEAAGRSRGPGTVVNHSLDDDRYRRSHQGFSHLGVAQRLAALKGLDHAGWLEDPTLPPVGQRYIVSSDTLDVGLARELHVHDVHDLFGGVVPHPFIATKVITHPLVGPDAQAPPGWSHAFGTRVAGSVLRGFSAFTLEDAHWAGRLLLEDGVVRIKTVRGIGGRGQEVARDADGLRSILGSIDLEELNTVGLVLEENLEDVVTLSVGQVQVDDLSATYHGTQRLTIDPTGTEVYAGSTLHLSRGGFDDLLQTSLPEHVQVAIRQARLYDDAAHEQFPGFFSSRRNYDVAQGRNAKGEWRSGVLEQSWRVGGASGAEIAALEAFKADPALLAMTAATYEAYGESETPPGAAVYFNGVDEGVGQIVKYTIVQQA